VQAAPGTPIAEAFQSVAERMADRASVVNAERMPRLTIDRTGGKNRHLPIAR
jgi:ATP-binding protein involved in chromosome partitioning